MWIPESVFAAVTATSPVRSLLHVHLRDGGLDSAMRAMAQSRAFLETDYPGLEARVSSPWEAIRASQEMVVKFGRLCLLAGGVIAMLSGVGMANAVLVSVRQRRLDIGIRQAIGALPRDTVGQIVAETMLVAALAASIGTTVALVAGSAWCRQAGWPWQVDAGVLVGTAVASLLVGGCASLAPARAAARQDPIEALRS